MKYKECKVLLFLFFPINCFVHLKSSTVVIMMMNTVYNSHNIPGINAGEFVLQRF